MNPVFNCPQWVQQTVFYQIFPDRFFRSLNYKAVGHFQPWKSVPTAQGMCGGNLRGIIEKLDYIQSLGCNALYLCPIFTSASNHRYHTVDYFSIDPVLGTESDFDDLVKAVHDRKMRIILDGVFNHCSRGFFPFVSLMEQGKESPYRDWFYVDHFPLNAYSGIPNYRCWWNIPALPKFNMENPEVRNYLMRVGEFWMHRGIDGWRLDVPNEIDDDSFWQEFRLRVKAINPEAYIVGEIWEKPDRWLQGDQFDGVMNYPLRRLLLEFFFPEGMHNQDNLSTGEPESVSKPHTLGNATDFCKELQTLFANKSFGTSLNLLGSHDTPRITTIGKGHEEAQLMAWALLLFLPGSFCLYYGDEIALPGGKDPDNRRCFPWECVESGKEPLLYHFFRDLLAIRAKEDVWVNGVLSVRPEGEGILICRKKGNELLELRIGYPGPVPLGGLSARTEILFAHKKEPIEGLAGYFVAKGGVVLTKKHGSY